MKGISTKTILIAIGAICALLAFVTTTNLSTVLQIAAMRKSKQNTGVTVVQYVDENGNRVAPPKNGGNGGNSGNSGNTGNGGTVTPVDNGSASDNGNTATPADNSGSGSGDSGSGSGGSGTATPADNSGSGSGSGTSSGASDKAAVVKMYVDALNKAKSSAKTVTLVKDGALNYKNIFEAGALSSAAAALRSFFKVEAKNEAKAPKDLPPVGQNCNLNAANVKSATVTEKDGVKTIVIELNNATNPTVGDGGVGSAVNIIQESQITGGVSSIPGISLNNIKLSYENCKVTATIDANGNLTYLAIDAPCILSLGAKLLFTSIDNARVGIEVINEYKIAY